ncbi:MAG: helix-turn-helix domain-containing protein [Candidatus Omnitrophica bacterium]|nr:helix-turn-helix domain-containing protein [Candidatus Omnitrophota bacterium]
MLKPNIKIKLTNNEYKTLESVVRKSKSAQRDVCRAKIILQAAKGLGNKTIARKPGIAVNTVLGWRERFAKERIKGLKDKDRSGRPATFSPRSSA